MRRALRWACFAALLVPLGRYLHELSFEGDSMTMIAESRSILAHVAKGEWHGWGGQFPLLQKIPTLAMCALGWEQVDVLRGLAIVNFVAFALLLFWSRRGLPEQAGRLFVALLLCSPLLHYAHSSFGEMLAAAVTLGLAIACAERAPPWKVFLFFLLAALSKDTAAPFLVLLAIAAGERRWPLLIAATAAGAGCSLLFNYLKFGSVLNQAYLSPLLIVHSPAVQVSFFFGIWLSPNGGVVPTWPLFAVLLVLAARAALRNGPRVPFAIAVVALLGLTAGFSRWFAPLGWVSWGPRLMLPWLPAIGYVLVRTYPGAFEALVASPLRRAGAAAALAVAAVPNFAFLLREGEVIGRTFYNFDAICPEPAYISSPAYYYKCMNHGLWTHGSMVLEALRPSLPLLFAIPFAIVVADLAWPARPRRLASWAVAAAAFAVIFGGQWIVDSVRLATGRAPVWMHAHVAPPDAWRLHGGRELFHAAFRGGFVGRGADFTPVDLPDRFSVEVGGKLEPRQEMYADIIGNHPGAIDCAGFVVQQQAQVEGSFGFGFGNGSRWLPGAVFSLQPGKPFHLAITVDRGRIAVWVNGAQAATADAGERIGNSPLPITIGNWKQHNRPFHGEIYEARIVDGLLSADDIARGAAVFAPR